MTPSPDIDALKDEVSRAWLGRAGVTAVGVRQDAAGEPVVVVSLEGHDPGLQSRLQDAFRGRPVVLETDTGRIELRES